MHITQILPGGMKLNQSHQYFFRYTIERMLKISDSSLGPITSTFILPILELILSIDINGFINSLTLDPS